MLNPAQKIRLHRLRWAAFSLVALAYTEKRHNLH